MTLGRQGGSLNRAGEALTRKKRLIDLTSLKLTTPVNQKLPSGGHAGGSGHP